MSKTPVKLKEVSIEEAERRYSDADLRDEYDMALWELYDLEDNYEENM